MSKKAFRDFYRPHARVQYTGELVDKYGEVFRPVDRTKQSFLKECDINNIVKAFSSTGQWNHVSAKAAQGYYADLPSDLDYQTAQNIFLEAERAFMSLPSKIRDRFKNEPAAFLEFMGNPENKAEAIQLGLLNPPRPIPDGPPKDAPPAPAADKS